MFELADYFEAYELVELLGLTVTDIEAAFPDEIEEKMNAIREVAFGEFEEAGETDV